MDIYTPNATQERVAQARSIFGDNPQAVRAGIANNMTSSQTFQQPIQDQGAALSAMQQIADYDRQLAAKYQTGAQSSTAQIQGNNALLRNFASAGATPQETIAKGAAAIPTTEQMPVSGFLSPFVASGLASGQQQAATDTFDIAGQTRAALERVVGSEAQAYADALRYQIEQERLKAEEERLAKEAEEKRKQQQFENALAMAQLTGQKSFINPIDGQVYNIEGSTSDKKTEEANKATSDAWNTILSGSNNEYDVWKQIDMNQDALRASGVNVDKLWEWHKNLVQRVGNGPLTGITGGGESQGYVDLIKSGQMKIENVPAEQRQAVVTALAAQTPVDQAAPEKQEIVDLIDTLLGSKLGPMTGLMQVRGLIPGTKVQEPIAQFNTLLSKLSLDNREKLKGSGAISDFESRMLEKAGTTLSRATSETAFRKELENLRNILSGNPANRATGVAGPTPGPAPAPSAFEIIQVSP